MARTLSFTGEMEWPLEEGKQAAKLPLTISLDYTSVLAIEKVYSSIVVDEVVTLPVASVKFLLLRATGTTEDVDVKLNNNTNPITLSAGDGFLLVYNPDGVITDLTVSVAVAPATLQGFAFA